MKPMTEQEARAALKAAIPIAGRFDISVSPPFCYPRRVWHVEFDTHHADKAPMQGGGFDVWGRGFTLRAAVAKAIKAWRATQKKGAKR